jgi:hypothetical protein
MVWVVGARAFDRRSIRAITLAVLCCLPVIALDTFLHRLGPARLIVDTFVWLGLALACGAIRFDEMAPLVRMVLKARRGHAST